ncbi:MAG: hypothetical protein Q9225_006673 [Loekoesia sp. 1 TL-2023]
MIQVRVYHCRRPSPSRPAHDVENQIASNDQTQNPPQVHSTSSSNISPPESSTQANQSHISQHGPSETQHQHKSESGYAQTTHLPTIAEESESTKKCIPGGQSGQYLSQSLDQRQSQNARLQNSSPEDFPSKRAKGFSSSQGRQARHTAEWVLTQKPRQNKNSGFTDERERELDFGINHQQQGNPQPSSHRTLAEGTQGNGNQQPSASSKGKQPERIHHQDPRVDRDLERNSPTPPDRALTSRLPAPKRAALGPQKGGDMLSR